MIRRIPRLGLGLATLVAAVPATSDAANALRPRTPATFPADTPCVQTVTRGDVLHLDYSVPFDDTDLTADELPDSRRHQFFAFAEQRFDFRLPLWINQADYDRAEANGDIVQYGDAPILERDPAWPADTWVRIVADDARLPITMEQAAMGIDWDTSDTPPGTWLVAAYTWEPEQNLWSHRFGAVRVEDPADPAATGPTVMLQLDNAPLVTVGDAYAPPGCIEAPAGSTLTASWGLVDSAMEPQWVTFAQDVAVHSGALDLSFVAPDEAVGSVKLRVEITDPEGRSYVAYSPAVIGVLAAAGDDGPGEDGGDEAGDEDGGGGCRVGRAPSAYAWLAPVLFVLGASTRRRGRAALRSALGARDEAIALC